MDLSRENARQSDQASPPIHRLRPNALGAAGVLMLCVAAIAPAASMIFNVPVMASQAGAATPLAFVLSAMGILLLLVPVRYFASRISSAGGIYPWVRQGLGPMSAFQAGWLLLFAYALFEAGLHATVAGSLELLLSTYGVHLPGGWVSVALLLTLVVGLLSYFDVKLSLWVMVPFALLEVLGLLVLNAAITRQGGAAGHDLFHTLTLAGTQVEGANPAGVLGVGLAMTLGLLAFVGFETGAVYGEEAREPGRVIPLVLLALVISLSVLYIWTSYSATIGVGVQNAGEVLGNVESAPKPYLDLAGRYIGAWFGDVLVVLIITSNFVSAFAMHQTVTRYLYSLGREQIVPQIFGRTHPRWRSPMVAIFAQTVFTVLVLVVLGLVTQRSEGGVTTYGFGMADGTWQQSSGITIFSWIASLVTLALLIPYIMVNFAAPFFAHANKEFCLGTHLVAPVVSTLLLLLPIASYTLPPLPVIGPALTETLGIAPPAFPTNILPLVVGLWWIAGVFTAIWVRRRDPRRFGQIGEIAQEKQK